MNDETIRPELMNFGYEMKNLLGPSANVIAENTADGGLIIRVVWTTSIGAKYGYEFEHETTYSRKDVEIIPLVLILSDLYREIDNYSKDKRSTPEPYKTIEGSADPIFDFDKHMEDLEARNKNFTKIFLSNWKRKKK